MITQPRRHPRCYGCSRRGVRQVILDGRPVWFCHICLTPDEILQRAAEIRSTWEPWRWRQAAAEARLSRLAADDPERITTPGSLTHERLRDQE